MNGFTPGSHQAEVMKEALAYAALGWRVVLVHGIEPDGRCTCRSPHTGSESTVGKHPILGSWHTRATTSEEDVEDWYTAHPLGNVGVCHGSGSGIIDVEYDGPEGEATARELFSGIVTPTYQSGRSLHRIFQFEVDFPDTAVVTARGLEFRIGGGGRGSMSVFPPSRHWKGGSYWWVHGLDHSVEVVKLPDAARRLMLEEYSRKHGGRIQIGGDGSAPDPFGHGEVESKGIGRKVLAMPSISEGGRNETLFAGALSLAYQLPSLADPAGQAMFHELIRGLNLAKCRPPLDDEEVAKVANNAVRYALSNPTSAARTAPKPLYSPPLEVIATATEDAQEPAGRTQSESGSGEPGSVVESRPDAAPAARIVRERLTTWGDHGLKCSGGSWGPGNWRLVIVHSEPVTYRLHVPAWVSLTDDLTGDIWLSVSELQDAGKVAAIVLRRTRSVLLESKPRIWSSLWNGTKDQPGLLGQLMAEATEEEAPADTKGWVPLAEWFLAALSQAPEGTEPDRLGSPVRIESDVYFAWRSIWSAPIQQGRFRECDVADLYRRLKVSRFRRHLLAAGPDGGGSKRFNIAGADEIKALAAAIEAADRAGNDN